MGIDIKHTVMLLVVMSSLAVYLPHARGSCGGHCSLGGSSSYDFLSDPAVNMDMSSPDDFVRDNAGTPQTVLATKSSPQKLPINNSSSLNQTNIGNTSQNNTTALGLINALGNRTSDNATSNDTKSDIKVVKLGASMQNKGLTTLAFSTFNSNMF